MKIFNIFKTKQKEKDLIYKPVYKLPIPHNFPSSRNKDIWMTFGICKCLEYGNDISFNNMWFSRNDTCPKCGEIGEYIIITCKVGNDGNEIKIGDKNYKFKTKNKLEKLINS